MRAERERHPATMRTFLGARRHPGRWLETDSPRVQVRADHAPDAVVFTVRIDGTDHPLGSGAQAAVTRLRRLLDLQDRRPNHRLRALARAPQEGTWTVKR